MGKGRGWSLEVGVEKTEPAPGLVGLGRLNRGPGGIYTYKHRLSIPALVAFCVGSTYMHIC